MRPKLCFKPITQDAQGHQHCDLPPTNRTSCFSKKSTKLENDLWSSKYSEEQIIGFLSQAEAGMPISEIVRKHGFSDASFYKWGFKYGGMDASEAKRLRELGLENGKLARLLADAHLNIYAFKKRVWDKTGHLGATPTNQTRSGQ